MDLYQIDFSDPQGGKGPCDRKAVQIKTQVKQRHNTLTKAHGIGGGNFRSWTSFSGMFNQEVVKQNYSHSW